MRAPSDLPRRRRARSANRGRIILIVVAAALLALFASLRGIAGFYTDYLWYDSLGFSEVFTGVLGTKIFLAVAFTLLFFVLLWTNLYIADRIAPKFRLPGPEEDFVERYQQLIGRRAGLVRVVVALLFALIAGVGVSGQWRDWLLFRNAVSFGEQDPLFDTDIGFYVFRLPFLSFLVSWTFAAIVIITVVTAAAHYLNGGIRVQAPTPRVTPQVKAHLSVLLGALALLKAAGYWLQRYELTLSTRGYVDGAGYTDVKAQLPAINLLILISLFAAVLLIVNIRSRGWVLPVIAVGLWGLVAVVAGAIYPAFIQRFRVQPAESTREAEYIQRNIDATRRAIGLDEVEIIDYPMKDPTEVDLEAYPGTIRHIRQLDPGIVLPTFQGLQGIRSFYQFSDVDVDRYEIDGEVTQVVVGARELNTDGLPVDSWEGVHLRYTNGYGLALAPANRVTENGRPLFEIGNLPPTSLQGAPVIEQPSIYFGEGLPGYAIVDTEAQEIAYVSDEGEQTTSHSGEGGVGIGSPLRRVAFALRFWNLNPLLSNYITGDSRILYVRDVRERVEKLAPFLDFDADPYPVLIDGRLSWIIDAYTTTSRYPYAQRADTSQLPGSSGLDHRFNYIRNSVKAVVDAYNGFITFYVVDEEDPLIRAYRKAFPDLFVSGSEAPDELRAHFRYPEDLFRVQTNMWGRYHLGTPGRFYSQSDAWNVAQDPSVTQRGGAQVTQTTNAAGEVGPAREQRIAPYYQLMQLPGRSGEPPSDAQFVLLRPFVPASEDDSIQSRRLSAFMVAGSDPENYGRLQVYVMPAGRLPDGPSQVAASIQQENNIAQELSLLDQAGSEVRQGNLLLLPIDDSIIWVRPIYVRAPGPTSVPELRKMVVTVGERSYMGDNLAEALELAFGEAPEEVPEEVPEPEETTPPVDGQPPTTTTTVPSTTSSTAPSTTVPSDASVADLLAEADRLFAEADAALDRGDLGAYQRAVDQARELVRRASGQLSAPSTTAPAPPGSVAPEGQPGDETTTTEPGTAVAAGTTAPATSEGGASEEAAGLQPSGTSTTVSATSTSAPSTSVPSTVSVSAPSLSPPTTSTATSRATA